MRSTRPAILLLLLVLAPGAPGQGARPVKLDETIAVVNDQIITLRDVGRELGTRHLTDPELRGRPDRIRAERNMIIRQLARRLLLEQAIYSLEHDASRIEQVLELEANAKLQRLRATTGSTRAFLAELKSQGLSIEEKKQQIRQELKWQVVLQELVHSRFAGLEGLLLVRPGEMVALYNSRPWRWRRRVPARAAIWLHQVRLGPDRDLAVAKKVMDQVARTLKSPSPPPLPEPVVSHRLLVIDCKAADLEGVRNALGLISTPARQVLSREGVPASVRDQLFGPTPPSGISPPLAGKLAVRVVQVEEFNRERRTPFTNPLVQEELKVQIITAKRHAAEQQLIHRLWNQARIWPLSLKRAGPPGLQEQLARLKR